MEIIEYPHLTDNPWRIVPIEGGWRYGTNLIPIRRSLNALDDKIRVALEEEIRLVKSSCGDCIPSPNGKSQKSVDIARMFVDLASPLGVVIVRALICDKLHISYANMMPKLHAGRRFRLYHQCGLATCIQPDHHRLNKGSTARIMDRIAIESVEVIPVDVATLEFYSAFSLVFTPWLAELEHCQGEPQWHSELNRRVAAWLATQQNIVREHRAMDFKHPVSVMELEGLDVTPEVDAYFIRCTPALDDGTVNVRDMIKR